MIRNDISIDRRHQPPSMAITPFKVKKPRPIRTRLSRCHLNSIVPPHDTQASDDPLFPVRRSPCDESRYRPLGNGGMPGNSLMRLAAVWESNSEVHSSMRRTPVRSDHRLS